MHRPSPKSLPDVVSLVLDDHLPFIRVHEDKRRAARRDTLHVFHGVDDVHALLEALVATLQEVVSQRFGPLFVTVAETEKGDVVVVGIDNVCGRLAA